MPSHAQMQAARARDAQRRAEEPALRLNRCGTCDAANPTKASQPIPKRCASCGAEFPIQPAWAGKSRFDFPGF